MPPPGDRTRLLCNIVGRRSVGSQVIRRPVQSSAGLDRRRLTEPPDGGCTSKVKHARGRRPKGQECKAGRVAGEFDDGALFRSSSCRHLAVGNLGGGGPDHLLMVRFVRPPSLVSSAIPRAAAARIPLHLDPPNCTSSVVAWHRPLEPTCARDQRRLGCSSTQRLSNGSVRRPTPGRSEQAASRVVASGADVVVAPARAHCVALRVSWRSYRHPRRPGRTPAGLPGAGCARCRP
jgi:hypothetical protein